VGGASPFSQLAVSMYKAKIWAEPSTLEVAVWRSFSSFSLKQNCLAYT
jgi:hypothetical protein